MKTWWLLTLIIVLQAGSHCFAQQDTTWLDKCMLECRKDQAYYYRPKPLIDNGRYVVKRYFLKNHRLEMVGQYLEDSLKTRVGHFEYYDSLGFVSEKGSYLDDEMIGRWEEYYEASNTLQWIRHYQPGGRHHQDTLFAKAGYIKRIETKVHDTVLVGHCYDSRGEEIPFFTYRVMPSFKGDVMKYLSRHVKYPEVSIRRNQTGRVIVGFTIDEEGNLVNPEVVHSVFEELDAEALRVVSNMKGWEPGLEEGKPAKVYFTQPITFRLN